MVTKNSEMGFFITGVTANLNILETVITGSITNTAINCKVIISTTLIQDFSYKLTNR